MRPDELEALKADVHLRIVVLGKRVRQMKSAYDRGNVKKAERLALDIHDEVGRLRHILLDQIWRDYQASLKDEPQPAQRP